MPMLLGMRAPAVGTLWSTVWFKKAPKALPCLGTPKAETQSAVEAGQESKSQPDLSLYALGGCFWPDKCRD
jgi:hypothetical protein